MTGRETGLPPREAMEFDTVIVGVGLPARPRRPQDISVVAVEKGSEVGSHILHHLDLP